MRTLGALCHRSNVRSPRFRRDPFVRDVVFDPGRASAPRIAVPHMLPSTLLTASASAISWISWLNSTPHTITVYASHPPSPATTQHSLPGARYGLPGPVSHRQDNASLPGAQAIHTFFAARWIASSLALLAMTATTQIRSSCPDLIRASINLREKFFEDDGSPGHRARRRAEPVIGPRFARTRWRFRPVMTIPIGTLF